MATPPIKKKLRNGPVIDVDPQVLRWRQKMRKLDIQLGRNMRKEKQARDAKREEERKPPPTKRKWF
jgi:hypothetical protein